MSFLTESKGFDSHRATQFGSLAVTTVHRTVALCRSSFESLTYNFNEKQYRYHKGIGIFSLEDTTMCNTIFSAQQKRLDAPLIREISLSSKIDFDLIRTALFTFR